MQRENMQTSTQKTPGSRFLIQDLLVAVIVVVVIEPQSLYYYMSIISQNCFSLQKISKLSNLVLHIQKTKQNLEDDLHLSHFLMLKQQGDLPKKLAELFGNVDLELVKNTAGVTAALIYHSCLYKAQTLAGKS